MEKKLYELLKRDEDLSRFLETSDFKGNSKRVEMFKRLIVTLIGENIFESSKHNYLASIGPLSKEEYSGFGEGDFMGSLLIRRTQQK